MDDETKETLKKLDERLAAESKRIDRMRDVIFSYLEYGSAIGLSSVKANLKNV